MVPFGVPSMFPYSVLMPYEVLYIIPYEVHSVVHYEVPFSGLYVVPCTIPYKVNFKPGASYFPCLYIYYISLSLSCYLHSKQTEDAAYQFLFTPAITYIYTYIYQITRTTYVCMYRTCIEFA